MIRRCLKPIDEEETILCARPENHEQYDAKGCCPHEETIGDGKNQAGRLRRKCTHCGDKILAAEMLGQEYLHEEELCYEVSLVSHADIADYYIDPAGFTDPNKRWLLARPGVNPDATRAVSSATLKFDKQGRITEVKLALWSKGEFINMAGKRFNAFPNRFEVTDAAGMLAKLAGVSKDELPEAEEG